jgi:hypothetical protein
LFRCLNILKNSSRLNLKPHKNQIQLYKIDFYFQLTQ